MWHLPKPDLQKTLDDVDVFESLGIISSAENLTLKQLVNDYDNQKAFLTQQQLSTIKDSTAKEIHSNYELTHEGRRLSGIRHDLCKKVGYCPYCGINQIQSLDHYMDESKYEAMALCRLNLVPMCMSCNGPKSKRSYTGFINPYYLSNPDVEFFICTITIDENDIVYNFSIKDGVFDEQQTLAIKNQINVIKLNERCTRAAILYLQNEIFKKETTPQSLIASLPSLIQERTTPKTLNHWQTAVLRGLQQTIDGNIAIAQQILKAVKNEEYF